MDVEPREAAGRDFARDRARLLARVERQFRTWTSPLRIGRLTLEFTRIADPEEVLERLETSPACPWQPYWAEAWDSGNALARMLETQSLHGQRVLDLGCGLGLAGTVAAARGADVLMADAAPPALLLARLNSWPWRRRVACRKVDWREDQLDGPGFDILVGADILYDRSDWAYLESFWRRHLGPRGKVLLGEPGRASGREFPAWLAERGWQVRPLSVVGQGQDGSTPMGTRMGVFEATLRCTRLAGSR